MPRSHIWQEAVQAWTLALTALCRSEPHPTTGHTAPFLLGSAVCHRVGRGVLTLSRRRGCCPPWDPHCSKPPTPDPSARGLQEVLGETQRPVFPSWLWGQDPGTQAQEGLAGGAEAAAEGRPLRLPTLPHLFPGHPGTWTHRGPDSDSICLPTFPSCPSSGCSVCLKGGPLGQSLLCGED